MLPNTAARLQFNEDQAGTLAASLRKPHTFKKNGRLQGYEAQRSRPLAPGWSTSYLSNTSLVVRVNELLATR